MGIAVPGSGRARGSRYPAACGPSQRLVPGVGRAPAPVRCLAAPRKKFTDPESTVQFIVVMVIFAVLGIAGWQIYKRMTQKLCPNCGRPADRADNFCRACGRSIPS